MIGVVGPRGVLEGGKGGEERGRGKGGKGGEWKGKGNGKGMEGKGKGEGREWRGGREGRGRESGREGKGRGTGKGKGRGKMDIDVHNSSYGIFIEKNFGGHPSQGYPYVKVLRCIDRGIEAYLTAKRS